MSTIKVNRFENTSSVGYGCVLQVVNTQSSALQTITSATIGLDDTIPQNTEGVEITGLATTITPKSATNKLRITVNISFAGTTGLTPVAALFQDSTANAIAASFGSSPFTNTAAGVFSFTHYMTAGTTSATTFKIRAASDVGTIYINGRGAGRYFGGVATSSITIEEIQV